MSVDIDPTIANLLRGSDVSQSNLSVKYSPNDSKSIKQRRYRSLMRGINLYSYSTFSNLHACERKLSCSKLELSRINAQPEVDFSSLQDNVDFAFGRAVESGVQSTLLGKSEQNIWFDMFLAWDVPLWIEHPKVDKGTHKSFTDAVIAIDKWQFIYQHMLDGWEIAKFHGKPAIELSFCIDLENGYYYVGHTDIVLYNPMLNRYKVLECKTTGYKYLHEAMYKNSDQAIGYSIVLDSIAEDQEATATFEVFYLIYMTVQEQWKQYEFTKSRSNRADWINSILLDIQRINTHRNVGIWPKRGGSCFDFGRPCTYFELCDLDPASFNGTGDFDIITEEELKGNGFDFWFTMRDIIETQQGLIG